MAVTFDSPGIPVLTEEAQWKITYLQRWSRKDWGTSLHQHDATNLYSSLMREHISDQEKLLKIDMQNAWRQHRKRKLDKKAGIQQHTFTLSNRTMTELKKLARSKRMGLSETLGHVINATYQVTQALPKKR